MSDTGFFAELSRRNVYKVAITYTVVAWLFIEIVAVGLPILEAPPWLLTAFIVFFAIGLLLVLYVSWNFEATPEGLKRTSAVPVDATLPTWSSRKYATFVVVVGAMAALLMAFQLVRPATRPRDAEPATSEERSR